MYINYSCAFDFGGVLATNIHTSKRLKCFQNNHNQRCRYDPMLLVHSIQTHL